MGLLDLLIGKRKATLSSSLSESKKHTNLGDREIKELNKADKLPLEKRIEVYERILPSAHFNAFNQRLALSSLYLKAGQNDKAWGYLNQLYQSELAGIHFAANAPKIRKQQYAVLKADGKYAQAIEMLLCSFLLSGSYGQTSINREFLPTAKKAGFSHEQTEKLLRYLDSVIGKKCNEAAFLRAVRGIISNG